jgi:hypothetical protein
LDWLNQDLKLVKLPDLKGLLIECHMGEGNFDEYSMFFEVLLGVPF